MLLGSKGISVFVMPQGAGKYLLPLEVLVFCADVSFLVLRYCRKARLELSVVIDLNYSLKNNCRTDVLRWLFLVPGSVCSDFIHSDVLQGKGS